MIPGVVREHRPTLQQLFIDCLRGIETLRTHKLRSLLTMLGMIFGVAAWSR